MKQNLLKLGILITLSFCILTEAACSKPHRGTKQAFEQYYTKNEYSIDANEYSSDNNENGEISIMNTESTKKNSYIDTESESITILVNKTYTLSPDYTPSDLVIPNIDFCFREISEKRYLRKEAADAITELFQQAFNDGISLSGVSGYRSYDRQYEIYVSNLIRRGPDNTNLYSAMAGSSEHQTGLAMDVSTKSVNYRLDDDFADTKEGQWLADNCYRYGFIIRYPADKTHITGYAYEPWHIRYVGVELATYLTENHLTLDEYYEYQLDPNLYANVDYDAIIDKYFQMKGIPRPANTYLTSSKHNFFDYDTEEIVDSSLNSYTGSSDSLTNKVANNDSNSCISNSSSSETDSITTNSSSENTTTNTEPLTQTEEAPPTDKGPSKKPESTSKPSKEPGLPKEPTEKPSASTKPLKDPALPKDPSENSETSTQPSKKPELPSEPSKEPELPNQSPEKPSTSTKPSNEPELPKDSLEDSETSTQPSKGPSSENNSIETPEISNPLE